MKLGREIAREPTRILEVVNVWKVGEYFRVYEETEEKR